MQVARRLETEVSRKQNPKESLSKARIRELEERRLRRAMHAVMIGAVVLCLAVALLFVGMSSAIARTAYEINSLKTEIATIEGENERLGYQLASLGSLERIETFAENELGMIRPAEGDILYVALGAPAAAEEETLPETELPGSTENRILAAVGSLFN